MLKESATGALAPFAGVWAYPWDIAQWGIKRTVEKVRNAGITDLSVATVYHSGQILSLATGEPRFFTRNDGPLFRFRQDVWQDGGLEIRPQQFYRELSGQLRAEGIRLRGWVIAGHDQTHLKPVINAFGQEIRHAACPVANQEQFVQMITDLATWDVFSGLDLESVGYTAAVHDAHHDISGIVITPLLRILSFVRCCVWRRHRMGTFSSGGTRQRCPTCGSGTSTPRANGGSRDLSGGASPVCSISVTAQPDHRRYYPTRCWEQPEHGSGHDACPLWRSSPVVLDGGGAGGSIGCRGCDCVRVCVSPSTAARCELAVPEGLGSIPDYCGADTHSRYDSGL